MQQSPPLAHTTPDANPPPQAHAARLMLCTSRKRGWFRSIPCYLVFQDQEVILVHMDNANTRQAAAEFRAEQKAQGKGVIATTFAMVGFWRNYGQRYYESSRDELLGLYRDNVAIPYNAIRRLVFRTARTHQPTEDFATTPTPGKLIIRTQQEKWKFTHEYCDRKTNIKRILKELLGNALSYRAPLFHKVMQINIGGSPAEID